jgi:glycosyltransferase involved in cell wall biosynthesis
VHSEHARGRLLDELSVRADKVAVIPHGSFDYLTRLREELPIDEAAGDLEGRKVVLCFGLIRPYKGIDLLLEAFASTPDEAVLLVVGRPLMPIEPLRRRARELGIEERVRLVPRFVAESEVPAYFRRADLVTLPYRDADQSGVVFTALAFGAPLLLSAVGGFVELAEQHGAARLVPPDDIDALAGAIVELLADDAARAALSKAARRAAEGPYSWSRAAHLTHELYLSLWDESR